ncbi:MAG TPA: LysR family transcriptional regulator, partial [Myxococcota bacterium]
MHIEWNDLQTIAALVRAGTIEGAARALGLTHPSVSRRLTAIETRLSTSLFVRGPRLVPTPLALQIAEHAHAMQQGAADVDALLAAEHRRRDGRFVVTTNDVLAPLLFRALAAVPQLQVEVVVGDTELVLGPGQVDLALRPGHDDQDPSLRGRRLGQLQLGVFDVVASAGVGDMHRCWVRPDDALRARRSMRWWRHIPDEVEHRVTCNTLLGVRDACAAGLG